MKCYLDIRLGLFVALLGMLVMIGGAKLRDEDGGE